MPKLSNPRVSVELKPSRINSSGVGVFAIYGFKKGDKIFIPAFHGPGVFLPWDEVKKLDKEVQRMITRFCIGDIKGVKVPLDFDQLPVTFFLNHSCDFNVGFSDKNYYVAVKDINAGDELYLDYGLAISDPNYTMECQCRSLNCRKIITGNDWYKLISNEQNKKFLFSTIRSLLKTAGK